MQGAYLGDGVVGHGQSLGFSCPYVYFGEDGLGPDAVSAVALAVGAYRAGGEVLGGVESVQVELSDCCCEVGARAVECVGGCPSLVGLGEVALGLVGFVQQGISGGGLSVQSRGQGWESGVIGVPGGGVDVPGAHQPSRICPSWKSLSASLGCPLWISVSPACQAALATP